MGINQVSSQATAYVPPDLPQRAAPANVPDANPVPAPVQSAPQPAQSQTAEAQISQSQIEEAVKRVKESIKPISSNNLEFSIDDTTGQTVVKVIDSSTKELIRQIPSEEMLAIAKALDGEIKGLLVRNKA